MSGPGPSSLGEAAAAGRRGPRARGRGCGGAGSGLQVQRVGGGSPFSPFPLRARFGCGAANGPTAYRAEGEVGEGLPMSRESLCSACGSFSPGFAALPPQKGCRPAWPAPGCGFRSSGAAKLPQPWPAPWEHVVAAPGSRPRERLSGFLGDLGLVTLHFLRAPAVPDVTAERDQKKKKKSPIWGGM